MTISRFAGLRLLPLLPLLTLLASCASNTPVLDRSFGVAVTANTMLQVLDPAAPHTRSAAGIDGKAAKSAFDNYQKSYQEPVPQTGALAIGVGR